jgi:hypothetical protein
LHLSLSVFAKTFLSWITSATTRLAAILTTFAWLATERIWLAAMDQVPERQGRLIARGVTLCRRMSMASTDFASLAIPCGQESTPGGFAASRRIGIDRDESRFRIPLLGLPTPKFLVLLEQPQVFVAPPRYLPELLD